MYVFIFIELRAVPAGELIFSFLVTDLENKAFLVLLCGFEYEWSPNPDVMKFVDPFINGCLFLAAVP